MFQSMPNPDEDALEQMSRAFGPWVAERLAAGMYLGWIVEADGQAVVSAVASAGMLLVDWPPHPLHPESNRRGYVLNVFVEPAFRRRGLAQELILLCLAEAQRRKIQVVTLHASQAGRLVYEKLGFQPTSEMIHVAREKSGLTAGL
jgi:ribosomal protein S18 acetylase RimI-like enzyme